MEKQIPKKARKMIKDGVISLAQYKSCIIKSQIKKEGFARERAKKQSRLSGEDIGFYKCLYCEFFHSGHRVPPFDRIENFLLKADAENFKETIKKHSR